MALLLIFKFKTMFTEIDQDNLADVIASLIERAGNFDGEKASTNNLIDPFAAALESALNGYKSEADWKVYFTKFKSEANFTTSTTF